LTTVADLPASAELDTRPGSCTFGNDLQGNNEAICRWYVPYADLLAFREKTLYTTGVVTINPDPLVEITRVFPLVCPIDSSLVALTCEGTSKQPNKSKSPGPWQVAAGVYSPHAANPPFPLWDVVVRFGRVPYPSTSGDQAFLSVTKEDRIERRTVPNHPYELISDAGAHVEWVTQDIALPAGTYLYRVTWHEIVDLPSAEAIFAPILDTINSTTITIPLIGTVCPPGTLHCAGGSSSSSITFGNVVKSSLSATLIYFPGGWNRAVASAAGFAGQMLRITSAAGPPFAAVNFLPIFNPTV
jgi:hypothetical protein